MRVINNKLNYSFGIYFMTLPHNTSKAAVSLLNNLCAKIAKGISFT